MALDSRRIFFYWILLLVPTLAVGTGAIVLLRGERKRLEERTGYADEARRAAVAARTSLIVENVELLVGAVQDGLLDTLAAVPAAGLDGFLDSWEKNNRLVRTAFLASPEGRVLRPGPEVVSEAARGFVRRFSKSFADRPPWAPGVAPSPGNNEMLDKKKAASDSPIREQAANNVSQYQSQRRDVQEEIKTQAYSAASNSGLLAESDQASARSRAAAAPTVGAQGIASADARPAKAEAVLARAADGHFAQMKDALAERRGWSPLTIDGRLHLVGWVQPGGMGTVRGVELELAAVIDQLSTSLPVGTVSGEGYALRDDQGRTLHQVGAVPRTGEPAIRIPLAASVLPGWEAVAFLPAAVEPGPGAAAFFLTGSLLIGVSVVAILAAGGLMLRQARISGVDAAQKSSFVANVSHEFKTPLTTIRLYAELLEQGRIRDAAQGADYLKTIGQETQRLARLVNNVLDFSRLEQGGKKFARETVALKPELARILAALAPRLAESGMALTTAMPDEAVEVRTDRDALEQIVLNLVDNACKYASEGGAVSVSLASRDGGGAEIRVMDRGPGVPAGHGERIFEKFHRVDETLTAGKTGAGLGLSIARQLARGLGGELRFEPRDGGGAVFVLELR